MKKQFWILLCCWVQIAASEPPIKVGMSTALSGPTQELGQQMKKGVEIYFARINSDGGIAGRPLQLIVLDDQYEPLLVGPNMRQLIDRDQVLAIIGNVGSPTAVVSVPIANQKQVLLFGAFTGSEELRKTPPDRYVINLRASYKEETAALVKGLLSTGIKPDEIAFFTQNDAFGDSGYEGAMAAIRAAGYTGEDLPNARYTRNTLNVDEGLADLIAIPKTPRAIIILGAYAPVAKFIKMAKKEFPHTLFLNVSFVGSAAFAQELGADGNGVIVTQVVPHFDSDLPAAHDYLADLKKYGGSQAEASFVSFEGYLVAKLFVLGLKKAAGMGALTREGIINAFEQMGDVDIGIGVKISFDRDNHQGLHAVWPMVIENGKYLPLDWSNVVLTQGVNDIPLTGSIGK